MSFHGNPPNPLGDAFLIERPPLDGDALIAIACRIGMADSAATEPPPDVMPVAQAAEALAQAFILGENVPAKVEAYENALKWHYANFLRKVLDIAPIMERSTQTR